MSDPRFRRRDFLRASGTGVAATIGISKITVAQGQDLFEIHDWYDFDDIRGIDQETTIIFQSDLDNETTGYDEIASTTANNGDGFKQFEFISNNIDGNGHTIADLYTTNNAIFDSLSDQTVENLIFENITVETNTRQASVVAGSLFGTNLRRCGVTNSDVESSDSYEVHTDAALLAARIQDGAVIRECFAEGTLAATDAHAGLLVGNFQSLSENILEDCFAQGMVTVKTKEAEDPSTAGGLIGVFFDGQLNRVYSDVDVENQDSERDAGPIAGLEFSEQNHDGIYWDEESSNLDSQNLDEAIPLATDKMQGEAAPENMPALNFDETWDVVTDPANYPVLAWQDEPVDEPSVEMPLDSSNLFEDGELQEHNFAESSFTEDDVGTPVSEFDLTNADTSSVEDMSNMFRDAESFDQDIGDWDTSNVEDMSQMFQGAKSFDQSINTWCVEQITNQPNEFDDNAGFEDEDAKQPNWGKACTPDDGEEHESGVSEELADSIAEEQDLDINDPSDWTLGDIRTFVDEWDAQTSTIYGTDATLGDLRLLVDWAF